MLPVFRRHLETAAREAWCSDHGEILEQAMSQTLANDRGSFNGTF